MGMFGCGVGAVTNPTPPVRGLGKMGHAALGPCPMVPSASTLHCIGSLLRRAVQAARQGWVFSI